MPPADTWKLGGLFGTGAYAYADTQVPVWSAALGRFVPGSGGGGGGDVVGPAASVDKEIALFDGTTGKLLERATGTGIVRVTSGVYGTPGNVVESEITLADNTTNNVSNSAHGFAPKNPNDATKYLDGTGAYSVPAGSAASGSVVWLGKQVASASSTLDFTSLITSSYDAYLFVVVDLIPGSNTIVDMRLSTDNGATYESSGTDGVNGLYDVAASYYYAGSSGSMAALSAYNKMPWRDSNTTLEANGAFCARLLCLNLLGAKNKKIVGEIAWDDSSVGIITLNYTARLRLTTAINAVRFLPRSGTFTSGTIHLYGLKNS